MTLGSGAAYDLGYSYQTNGANVNITGSPDWGGRVIYINPNATGGGCSGNWLSQFNASDVKGPGYSSVGMESGRNILRGCWTKELDMSFVRRLRVFKSEKYKLEARADVFNLPNAIQLNARNTTATFNNPTSMTLVNNQYNADGSVTFGPDIAKERRLRRSQRRRGDAQHPTAVALPVLSWLNPTRRMAFVQAFRREDQSCSFKSV